MSDLQLLFPDNNVSSRPIVQFAAREMNLSSPGHAFVLVGIELDNGLTYFQAAGGFYPKDAESKMEVVKNVLYSPGQVTYKLQDAGADERFTVHVTQEQSDQTKKAIESWNHNQYAIWLRNCVNLTRDVAAQLGLEIPQSEFPDFYHDAPAPFIRYLRDRNSPDRPLEFDRENSARKAADEAAKKAQEEQSARERAAAAYLFAQQAAAAAAVAAERQRAMEAQAAADLVAAQQRVAEQQRIQAEQAAAAEAQRMAAEQQRLTDEARRVEAQRAAQEALQRQVDMERQRMEAEARQQEAQRQAAEAQRLIDLQRAQESARGAGGGGAGYYPPPPPTLNP